MPEAQDEGPAAGPIDLEAASLDDDDDERDVEAGVLHYGRRRRVGRVLAILVSLGLVCWMLELAASWRLEKAPWSLGQCMRDHGLGELQRCRTPWLLLPSVWPTTRSDALELRADLAYELDELRLSRATRVEFDPATAELALAGMLDNEQALAQRYGVIDNLQDQGAHSAVLARAEADEQLEYYERVNASHSALLLGEPDRLIELIADGYELEFRFAGTTYGPAWLCLRDPERGAAAMLQMAANPTDAHARNMSRIALLACGGPETDASVLARQRLGKPTSPAAQAWLAAREADHGRRSAAKWLDANTNNTARAQVIAMAMRDEAASIERLASWLAPSPDPRASNVLGFGHDLHRAGRGMIVSHRHDAAITYDPATMAAAAAQLAMLAEIAAPEAKRPESPEDTHDQPLSTADVLRRGAAVLADEAALEWLARGRSDEALRLARRARPWHRAEHEHIAVGLGLLAGDYEGTLAWIEARRAARREGHATVSALILDELELRALAGLGRWHEAHARALERHADDHDRAGLLCGHELVMQTWMLALSIQVAEQPSELVLAQQLGTRTCPWQSEELAQFAHLLSNPDIARSARLRGLHMPLSSDYPDLVVRAIGAVAHAPAHEERWLDAEIQFEDKLGRELLWARAEAARWRGDIEAEQRWRQRLARLLALGDSEDRALLLHAAGL